MRVVLHTLEFNITAGGPCSKRMDSFARRLVERGHEVYILTGTHNKVDKMLKDNEKYKILYCSILALGKKKTIYRLIEQMSFAISSFFVGLFKLPKADALITTSPPILTSITGYLLSKIKRSKLLFDVRDIWPEVALEMNSFDKNSIYYKVFNFVANFMYRHSDYVTTVSPGKVKKLEKKCKNKSKVWYIANGLDDKFLEFSVNDKIISKYKLDDKFTVVYTGNVGLAQNLDALVDLANLYKENNDIQFLIFGDGAYKEALIKKIENLHLSNVFLEGKVEYKDMYTILKYSKISFVSLKNNKMTDSVPTKLFDALGAGCPVLLLASGDSADILEASGLGKSAKSFDELKEQFAFMLNNYKNYNKQKEACVEFVLKNYSRDSIADKLIDNLEELC